MKTSRKTQLPFTVIRGSTQDKDYPYTLLPASAPQDVQRHSVLELSIAADKDGAAWDPSDYLIAEFNADTDSTVEVYAAFYCRGKNTFTLRNRLIGRRPVKCCMILGLLDSSMQFPTMLPGQLKGDASGFPTDINTVDEIRFGFMEGKQFRSVTLTNFYVTDTLPDLSVSGNPLVDKFGQKIEGEWKGKIHSEDELTRYLKKELAWAKTYDPSAQHPELDSYGGWKQLSFEKRDHFYLHHDGKRYWLVDPEGNAFFSNGICYGNRTGIYGMVDSMRSLFAELPDPKDPLFSKAYTTADSIPEYIKRNGKENGKHRLMFNFARANMLRVFGEDWFDAWVCLNTARMKAWGFNTISVGVNNYSDERTEDFLRAARMPYCITLKDFPKTEPLLFRDFPDVFSPDYEAQCEQYASQLLPYADDRYLIGCFLTNEPEWMFQKDVNVAERAMAYPVMTHSKRYILAYLKEKYGTVTQLNRAFGTAFPDFAALEAPLPHLDETSREAAEVFHSLRERFIGRYCAVPTAAIRRIAPHALNLGMRYASAERESDFDGQTYADVFSFNCYSWEPDEKFRIASQFLQRPFLVGEWHAGSSDCGMLSNALVSQPTQAERGKYCAEYMRSALTNPLCVGVHYFEWNDQPLLGRFDGENFQLGLVDVCLHPYDDCIRIFSEINRRMYSLRNGDESMEKIPWIFEKRY